MSRVDEMKELRTSIDAGYRERTDLRHGRAQSLAEMKQSVLEDRKQRRVGNTERANDLRSMLQGFMKQLVSNETKRQKEASHDRSVRLRLNSNRIYEVDAMRKAFQTTNWEARSAWRMFSK